MTTARTPVSKYSDLKARNGRFLFMCWGAEAKLLAEPMSAGTTDLKSRLQQQNAGSGRCDLYLSRKING